MGTLKWYARDPRAALTGMMELTLEERGAYNTILDLIYCHDGEVVDDEIFLIALVAGRRADLAAATGDALESAASFTFATVACGASEPTTRSEKQKLGG